MSRLCLILFILCKHKYIFLIINDLPNWYYREWNRRSLKGILASPQVDAGEGGGIVKLHEAAATAAEQQDGRAMNEVYNSPPWSDEEWQITWSRCGATCSAWTSSVGVWPLFTSLITAARSWRQGKRHTLSYCENKQRNTVAWWKTKFYCGFINDQESIFQAPFLEVVKQGFIYFGLGTHSSFLACLWTYFPATRLKVQLNFWRWDQSSASKTATGHSYDFTTRPQCWSPAANPRTVEAETHISLLTSVLLISHSAGAKQRWTGLATVSRQCYNKESR